VVLSPIQEMDPSGTLHNQRRGGCVNVSQGVLNPALFSNSGARPAPLPVSPIALSAVSMSRPLLSSLGITASSAGDGGGGGTAALTDVTADKDDSACGGSSSGSVSSADERKTPGCNRRDRGEVYV